jgi:VIT1/CCC1 family predicted Fe2+/Mn2+ transporter
VTPREPHNGHRSVSGGLARAAVFGVSDGLVSNVSLILGFAGSGVDSTVVRLAGLAGAVAGGISMAAGEWVSVTSQNDLIGRELEIERRELRHNTEHETAELAAVYESHGMSADRAAEAAADVMRHPEVALAVHAREELGIDPDDLPSAMWAAGLSLVCFLFGAVLAVRCPILRPGRGSLLAVQVQLDVRAAPAPRPRGSPAATGRRAGWPSPPAAADRVAPSGRPHTARSCCSNWLVTHASNVRWPELCGRGASSLISSSPPGSTKNSTHSTPTTSSDSSTAG